MRRDPDFRGSALRAALGDIAEGFRYMLRTSWLLATLLFACLLILVIMGPIEVLLPFAVRDQTGGGAGAFALVLALFGIGGAIGSLVVASLPLPRRYLTVMNLFWGAGCIPMVVLGLTDQLWLMAVVMFAVGFTFQAGGVLWGTLLQRRVPAALLGRVSSLDFFVSLALMPVSMGFAGPVGELVGTSVAFLVAGLVPPVLALAALLIFRMGAGRAGPSARCISACRRGGGPGASRLSARIAHARTCARQGVRCRARPCRAVAHG